MILLSDHDVDNTLQTPTDIRSFFRACVQEVADKARAALPTANGRVDAAVKIVLGGDVELLPDGTARVASQSNGTTTYHIVNGHCDCQDAQTKAVEGYCKHKLAHGIYKRATALAKQRLAPANDVSYDAPTTPTPAPTAAPLPEAPASVNVHLSIGGRQVQLTLRDRDEARLLARLDAVLARFPLTTPAAAAAPTAPRCPDGHGVMRPSKKGRGFYCAHKIDGKVFCTRKSTDA